ncbi:MAG: DUF1360 domain-containing protein [Chthoniobacterales bacterium]|nr:DUF1360 domain-containing protein [Chthoniobacterales bacterium]
MTDKPIKSRRKRRPPTAKATTAWVDGYSESKRPLGGYAALVGLFTVAFSGALAGSAAGKDDDAPALNWSDLILLGLATHKLSRIVTKDLVTSPFRAPFVKFKKSAGAGEVEEEARGEGLQEAVGDLISCPYCIAPWVASILVFAHTRAPRATRLVCSVFCVTAASDFLNQLYGRAKG